MSRQIKIVKLDDVKPYENNPRFNDAGVDAVAESIKEFGFKVPIVIDKDGIIVAGHTRYKAAQKLALKELPVIMVDDLNEEEVKAFRLADNKTGELSTWDWGLLEEELSELDIDMTKFGFAEHSISMDDYFHDEEYDKTSKERKTVCPHCGKETSY